MARQVPTASAPHANITGAINDAHQDSTFTGLAHYDSTEVTADGNEQYVDSPTPTDLASAATAINRSRTLYNEHMTWSNGGNGLKLYAHKTNDPAPTAVAAMDGTALTSTLFTAIKTLYLEIRQNYVNHINNKKLDGVTSALYHDDPDLVNILGSMPTINDQNDLAVDMNNLKAQYNGHIARGTTIHDNADVTNPVTADNAVAGNLQSFLTLVNQMKTKFNAHLILATTHGGAFGNDTQNTVAGAAAAYPAGMFDLANDLYTKYEAHRVSTTYHNAADATYALNGSLFPVSTEQGLVSAAADLKTNFNGHFRNAPKGRAVRIV